LTAPGLYVKTLDLPQFIDTGKRRYYAIDHHSMADKADIWVYADSIGMPGGQESSQTTWRLAKMNLAIRDIDSSQVKRNSDRSFLNDAHKDLKADYIIANPPFNVSDWGVDLLRTDGRWQYGTPWEMPILAGYRILFITWPQADKRVLCWQKVP
jgi:hypothetical protein